jgi:hypothetical protein
MGQHMERRRSTLQRTFAHSREHGRGHHEENRARHCREHSSGRVEDFLYLTSLRALTPRCPEHERGLKDRDAEHYDGSGSSCENRELRKAHYRPRRFLIASNTTMVASAMVRVARRMVISITSSTRCSSARRTHTSGSARIAVRT